MKIVIIIFVVINVLYAKHMRVIKSTLHHISMIYIIQLYIFFSIMPLILVRYCTLLDCESFIYVDCIDVFVIHV